MFTIKDAAGTIREIWSHIVGTEHVQGIKEIFPAPTGQSATVGVAAPAANAVLADTGPLPAGSYHVEWNCGSADTVAVGKGCVIAHRNDANGADIRVIGVVGANGFGHGKVSRLTITVANQRVVIRAGTAAGAASSLYAGNIQAYPVP